MMTMSHTYKLISRSFPLCSNFMSAGTDESRWVNTTTKFNHTNGILSNHLENCWPNCFDWKRQILDICHYNFLVTIRRLYISLTQSCAVDLNIRSNRKKKFPKIEKKISFPVRTREFLPIDDFQTSIVSQTS